MNDALEKYKDNDKVYSITGYSHTTAFEPNTMLEDTYFLHLVSTWSWATWKEKWAVFEDNSEDYYKYLLNNPTAKKQFNFDGSYNYFDMLKSHVHKQIDSWGVIWHLSVFQKQGLTLYPRNGLVQNIGFDGSGIHYNQKQTSTSEKWSSLLNNDFLPRLTDSIFEIAKYKNLVASLLKHRGSRLWKRLAKIKLWWDSF